MECIIPARDHGHVFGEDGDDIRALDVPANGGRGHGLLRQPLNKLPLGPLQ